LLSDKPAVKTAQSINKSAVHDCLSELKFDTQLHCGSRYVLWASSCVTGFITLSRHRTNDAVHRNYSLL